MKLRRMFFLLVLLLGQIGSVSTDAWMIWNHLRDFHGVEHVCRHECDVCLAHHSASVRCNCLRDHNEADRQLYVCSNGDASPTPGARIRSAAVPVAERTRRGFAAGASGLSHTAENSARRGPVHPAQRIAGTSCYGIKPLAADPVRTVGSMFYV